MKIWPFAQSFLTSVAVIAGLAAAPGCLAEEEEESDADESELNAPGGAYGPALFRNDFYTYLKRDGRMSDEDVRQLVLMPTEAAIQPPVKQDGAKPLLPYDGAFSRLKPSDFYKQGLITPLVEKHGEGDAPLETVLGKNRVHIVVVPGIFGEFIPVSPFEEVFRYGGAASVRWEQKLAEAEADPAKKDLTVDRQFSPSALKDVQRSLKDLVRVGSIDDAEGKPLVTITYLKPALGSLETFGTLDENADYYLSRLDKYFRVSGRPEHLYVMGYSRGTATALNLVTRAYDANAQWLPSLKGVVALAGVVYGSQLADAALGPGPDKEALDLTEDFVKNQLTSCDGPDSSLWLRSKNYWAWASFLKNLTAILAKKVVRNPELTREGIATENADLGRITKFVQRAISSGSQVFSDGDPDPEAEAIFRLDAPIAEHCNNVERFKKTATQVIKGVKTLSTDSRLEWFRTHTLPTNIRYFAINGTMGDATPEGKRPLPLVLNRTAYDTQSLDFRNLRMNFYDLFAAGGGQLQDSQVPVQRAMFWPELNSALNAKQKPIESYFLGTLGIHHWGLSFPRAFSTKDGLTANPFPRTILLKAIATFLAQIELGHAPLAPPPPPQAGGTQPPPATGADGGTSADGGVPPVMPPPATEPSNQPIPRDDVKDDGDDGNDDESTGGSDDGDDTPLPKKKKKKSDAGGCAAAPGGRSGAGTVLLGLVAATSLLRRRRSRR